MPRPKQGTKRSRRRLEVRYGPEQPQFIGYSGNLSKTGIMLRAVRVFAPGTILNLEVRCPEGTCLLRGKVVWAREGPYEWLAMGKVGMGVHFLAPAEDLLRALGA